MSIDDVMREFWSKVGVDDKLVEPTPAWQGQDEHWGNGAFGCGGDTTADPVDARAIGSALWNTSGGFTHNGIRLRRICYDYKSVKIEIYAVGPRFERMIYSAQYYNNCDDAPYVYLNLDPELATLVREATDAATKDADRRYRAWHQAIEDNRVAQQQKHERNSREAKAYLLRGEVPMEAKPPKQSWWSRITGGSAERP